MNYDSTTIDRSPNNAEKLSTLSKSTWPEFLRQADDYHYPGLFGKMSKNVLKILQLFDVKKILS